MTCFKTTTITIIVGCVIEITLWKISVLNYSITFSFFILKWIPRVSKLTKSVTRRRTLARNWIMLWHSIKTRLISHCSTYKQWRKEMEGGTFSLKDFLLCQLETSGRLAQFVVHDEAWKLIFWRGAEGRKPLKGHARPSMDSAESEKSHVFDQLRQKSSPIECPPAQSARISIAKPFPPHIICVINYIYTRHKQVYGFIV